MSSILTAENFFYYSCIEAQQRGDKKYINIKFPFDDISGWSLNLCYRDYVKEIEDGKEHYYDNVYFIVTNEEGEQALIKVFFSWNCSIQENDPVFVLPFQKSKISFRCTPYPYFFTDNQIYYLNRIVNDQCNEFIPFEKQISDIVDVRPSSIFGEECLCITVEKNGKKRDGIYFLKYDEFNIPIVYDAVYHIRRSAFGDDRIREDLCHTFKNRCKVELETVVATINGKTNLYVYWIEKKYKWAYCCGDYREMKRKHCTRIPNNWVKIELLKQYGLIKGTVEVEPGIFKVGIFNICYNKEILPPIFDEIWDEVYAFGLLTEFRARIGEKTYCINLEENKKVFQEIDFNTFLLDASNTKENGLKIRARAKASTRRCEAVKKYKN